FDEVPPGEEVDVFDGTQWPGMPWRYRTPELVLRALDGATRITTASDIYQFGTVFYELLTGFNPQRQPEKVTNAIELDLRDIRGEQGGELGAFIRDMLADAPGNRPSAYSCLRRLNLIHQAYCETLFNVTGQFV
ncbi:MAG: hypothetical protein OSA97_14145, partial [Nevskia sp.]|nr:hypothetical protein [Nevskia sp.]